MRQAAKIHLKEWDGTSKISNEQISDVVLAGSSTTVIRMSPSLAIKAKINAASYAAG
jgi:hypothetical protein